MYSSQSTCIPQTKRIFSVEQPKHCYQLVRQLLVHVHVTCTCTCNSGNDGRKTIEHTYQSCLDIQIPTWQPLKYHRIGAEAATLVLQYLIRICFTSIFWDSLACIAPFLPQFHHLLSRPFQLLVSSASNTTCICLYLWSRICLLADVSRSGLQSWCCSLKLLAKKGQRSIIDLTQKAKKES